MEHIQQSEQIKEYLETSRKCVVADLCMQLIQHSFSRMLHESHQGIQQAQTCSTQIPKSMYLVFKYVCMYVYIPEVLLLTRAGRTASGTSLLWFYNSQPQIILHKLVFESFEIILQLCLIVLIGVYVLITSWSIFWIKLAKSKNSSFQFGYQF